MRWWLTVVVPMCLGFGSAPSSTAMIEIGVLTCTLGHAIDTVTSALVIFGYAIPSFLFAVLLIVLFCGGSFWQIFPLRGLTSDNFADLSWPQKILDYLWHIALPVTALVLTIQLILQLKIFDQIYLFTQGGRIDANMVMVFYILRQAFQLNRGGIGAASAVVLFVVIVALSVLQFQLLRVRGQR